jgi:hypothetical protein
MFVCVWAVLLVSGIVSPIGASKRTTSVTLAVTDETGWPIPHAQINVANREGTKSGTNLLSGTDGRVKVELAQGRYHVTVAATGFFDYSGEIQVTNQSNTISVKLRVASRTPRPVVAEPSPPSH